MTSTIRAAYRETRRKLSPEALAASRALSAAHAEARRVELGRTPNGPPDRAERRQQITRKHKGEV